MKNRTKCSQNMRHLFHFMVYQRGIVLLENFPQRRLEQDALRICVICFILRCTKGSCWGSFSKGRLEQDDLRYMRHSFHFMLYQRSIVLLGIFFQGRLEQDALRICVIWFI